MSEISPTDAWSRRQEVTFLDVREQPEWDAGHIDGALHIPMGQLNDQLDRVPTGGTIVAVCRSGNRSGAVTTAMRRAGYDAVNLVGGMHAWADADLPYGTDDGSDPRVA